MRAVATKRWTPVTAFALLAFAGCSETGSAKSYGFLTTLGRDTISAERVSRTADTVRIESVDRFPHVRLRHTTVVLAPDKSVRRVTMDIRTPSAPVAKDRQRRVVADISRDSLIVTVSDRGGTLTGRFPTDGELTLPHVSQLYSIGELYLNAALAKGLRDRIRAGDSVTVLQFYPDDNLDHFRMHSGWVQPLKGDSVELWHGLISGVGFAMVDSAGRLLSYSGAQSTYKVEVKRLSVPPDVNSIAASLTANEQRIGPSQLSVRDTVRATVGTAQLLIDYSRPLTRGRKLLGNVIDIDAVWRTGANAATQLFTTAPITLGTLKLAPGGYTLWTIPHAAGAELIVSKETGQWGTEYDPPHDLGRTPLTVEAAADTVEKFTISVTPGKAKSGTLRMAWGTFRWSVEIRGR